MSRKTAALLSACALVGCGEEALPPGEVVLTLGQEVDVWSGAEIALVETENESGDRSELLHTNAPISRFDMGMGGVTTFVVSGLDAAGTARLRGRSLPVNRSGFAGIELPLFVSRANELARPPGNLHDAQPKSPPVEIMAGRYLYAFGGSAGEDAQSAGYDFGAWRPMGEQYPIACPSPPCLVRSFAIVAGMLGLIVGDDWGKAVDFDIGAVTDAPKPEGLTTFADVAGGATIHADDGTAYMVGGTRNGAPTASVIRIDPDGVLDLLLLTTPRAGAAATWVIGRGLVVVGGGDDQSAGAELLADGSDAFVTLPFPPDQTTGAALVSTDGVSVLRLGGRTVTSTAAETVTLALGCGTGCSAEPAGIPLDLITAAGFVLPSKRVLIVGEDPNGDTVASVWSKDQIEPLTLREPRGGASAIAIPTGHVGIVGGTHANGGPALSIELFIE